MRVYNKFPDFLKREFLVSLSDTIMLSDFMSIDDIRDLILESFSAVCSKASNWEQIRKVSNKPSKKKAEPKPDIPKHHVVRVFEKTSTKGEVVEHIHKVSPNEASKMVSPDDDIFAIRRLKGEQKAAVKRRQARKKVIFQERRTASKERDLQRRAPPEEVDTNAEFNANFAKIQARNKPHPQKANRAKAKANKEQSLVVQASVSRRKAAKQRKLANRTARAKGSTFTAEADDQEDAFGNPSDYFNRETAENIYESTREYFTRDMAFIAKADFDDLFKSMGITSLEFINEIARLAVVLHRVNLARDKVEIAELFYLHLSAYVGIVGQDVVDLVFNTSIAPFQHFIERWRCKFTTESDPMKMFELVMDSQLVSSIRDFILAVVGLKFFSKEITDTVQATLGKARKIPLAAFIRETLEILYRLYIVASRMIAGIPLVSALASEDPILDLKTRICDLLVYEQVLYTGLPTEHGMELKEFIMKGDALSAEATDLLKISNRMKGEIKSLHVEHIKLQRALQSAKNRAYAGVRSAPFGIILHGNPGTGKSKTLPQFARWWSEVKGRDFSPMHIFSKNSASEYWEGIEPFSHPFIHISELGNENKSLAQRNGSTQLNELVSLIDSLAFNLNMADVDKKGKYFAIPEMVLVDTNNPSMNADVVTSNPAAIKRRFVYIEQRVRPEFTKDGTCELDVDKVKFSNRDPMDCYLFSVERFGALTPTTDVPIERHSDLDIFQLECLLKGMYEKFLENASFSESVAAHVDDLRAESDILRPQRWLDKAESIKDDVMAYLVFNTHHVSEMLALALGLLCCYVLDSVVHRVTSRTIRSSGALFMVLALLLYSFYSCFAAFVVCTAGMAMFLGGAALKSFVSSLREDLACRLGLVGRIIHRYHTKGVIWSNPKISKSQIVMIAGGLAAFWYFFLRKTRSMLAEHSAFKSTSANHRKLEKLEDELMCGDSYKRIPTKLDYARWANVREVPAVPVCRESSNALLRSLSGNIRRAIFHRRELADVGTRSYIFGVMGDFALVNTHTINSLGDVFYVSVANPGHEPTEGNVAARCMVNPAQRHDIGNDLSVIQLTSCRFKDKLSHIIDRPLSTERTYKGNINGSLSRLGYKCEPLKVKTSGHGEITVQSYVEYIYSEHKSGFCGFPIICEYGSGFSVVAIHFAGADAYATSVGSPLLRGDIALAIEKIQSESPFSNLVSESLNHIDCALLEPLPKSPVHYVPLPGIRYLGRYPGSCVVNQVSKMIPLRGQDRYRLSMHSLMGFPYECDYFPPVMSPKMVKGGYLSPYNNTLGKLSSTKYGLDSLVCEKVINVLSERLIHGLRERKVPVLVPLDVRTAVNAVEHDKILRRVNASTGAGHGFAGKKSKHIPQIDMETDREPSDELAGRLISVIESMREGESFGCVYTGHLKDEPRLKEKVIAGKTRMFFIQPVDALIVHRMFLSPFYTLMVQFPDLFCTAVGYDISQEADNLVKKFKEFSDSIMEGDYSAFDQTMPPDIGRCVGTVVLRVLRAFGYSDTSLKVVECLMSENLFPTISVLQEIMIAPALQPSGKYATAEDNSLRNLVMLMYFWYTHRSDDFFENVLPITYGDDLLAAVKKEAATTLNNNSYSKFCASRYNMKYTSADKSSVFSDFITVHDMSFLKRTFVYSEEFERYLAILAPESIVKTVTWRIPSSFLSEEDQILSTLNSALREIFFHASGDVYAKIREEWIAIYLDCFDVPEREVRDFLATREKIISSLGW